MKPDFTAFDRCRILVVGDLMLDEYVWGSVERISPEAPVPVLSVTNEEFTLGGAGNVAKNIAVLGAHVAVAGVVGKGPQGRKLREELSKIGAEVDAVIEEAGRPTTRKTRILAEHQQMLRIDRETVQEISARSADALIRKVKDRLPATDVLLISDYGKGVVTRRVVAELAAAATGPARSRSPIRRAWTTRSIPA